MREFMGRMTDHLEFGGDQREVSQFCGKRA
jgi:hypothetical protein